MVNRITRTALSLLLGASLFYPIPAFSTETYVSNTVPSTYKEVTSPADLTALYKSGKIDFIEYRKRSNELAHKVNGSSGLASKPEIPMNPSPISITDKGTLAATQTPIQSTPSGSTPPVTVIPDANLATSFAASVAAPEAAASIPTSGAPIPTPNSQFIYQRLLTDLHIVIKDYGYGLDAGDKARLESYLDRLPIGDLEGVSEIDIGPNTQGIQETGGTLVINTERPSGPGFEWALNSQVSTGIGRYVYNNKLTATQKSMWDSLSSPSNISPITTFSNEYSAYTKDSANILLWAAGDPQNNIARLFSCTSAQGAPPCQPQALEPKPQSDLPMALFVASLFIHSTGGSSAMSWYSTTPNGEIPSWTARLLLTTSRRRGRRPYYSENIRMGQFSFTIKNGQIVGMANFGSLPQPAPFGPQLQTASVYSYDVPVNIPPMVLNSIPVAP